MYFKYILKKACIKPLLGTWSWKKLHCGFHICALRISITPKKEKKKGVKKNKYVRHPLTHQIHAWLTQSLPQDVPREPTPPPPNT